MPFSSQVATHVDETGTKRETASCAGVNPSDATTTSSPLPTGFDANAEGSCVIVAIGTVVGHPYALISTPLAVATSPH